VDKLLPRERYINQAIFNYTLEMSRLAINSNKWKLVTVENLSLVK